MAETSLAMSVLAGGGELGERMRAANWARTPLGPVESWPQSLRTCVRIVLTSRQPMFIWWGEQLINLYNDAYISILGGKHPAALGRPAADVWREIWDDVAPRATKAIHENEGTFDEALLLIMERNGYREETYYTFSYSPVPGDAGGPGGILCANSSDTQRIFGERQQALLREVAACTTSARTVEHACRLALAACAMNARDLPFAMLYRVDGAVARLAGTVGIAEDHPLVGKEITSATDCIWPVADVISGNQLALRALGDHALPTGAWSEPPTEALALPVRGADQLLTAVLVVGRNPFRLLDDDYRRFLDLLSIQIGNAITNARTFEEERRRAEVLAELDRAKTTFFSNISHEFRTPLTLMLGPTEDALAAGGVLEGEPLQAVHRNELRLLKLVNALLDFSRIEAGRMQARYAPSALDAVTADLASSFRAAIEAAGLRYTVECEPLGEPAYVDVRLWETIVLNLISNAFKFTFHGAITVSLRPRGTAAELTVRDTGVGIPEAEMPRLFERFHRIASTRSRTHEGTGIGLAMVQELVKLHDGTIHATSTLGSGTEFRVRIPLGRHHLPVDQVQPDEAAGPSAMRRAFVVEAERWGARTKLAEGPARDPSVVLVADDNADMRAYLANLLAPHWHVVLAANGLEALQLTTAQRPDVIVSDVMMPELDGHGLIAALRKQPSTSAIPVILVSARAGEDSRVEGLEAGADDYLIKPFSARELLARVRVQLELSRARIVADNERRRLYALFDQMPAFVGVHRGPEHVLEFQNARQAALTRTLGTLGKPFRASWPTLVEQAAILDRVYRSGTPELADVQVSAAFDGLDTITTRHFEGGWSPFRGGDGTIQGVISFWLDVTEAALAKQHAQQIEERLHSAVEAADVGTWHIEVPARRCLRDGPTNRLLARPPIASDQPLDEALDTIHPGDRERVRIAFDHAIASKGRYTCEYRVVPPDGKIRWVRDVGRVILGSDDTVVALTGALVDVTEQRTLLEQAAIARERLRAALDAAHIGTYFWDLDANRVEHDDGARRMFGLGAGGGDSFDEYLRRVHPQDRDALKRTLEVSARDGTPFDQEYRIITPDNSLRWVHDKATMFTNSEGRRFLSAAVVDVTELKVSAMRTSHALEMAENASRAKDEFLAMLGHELRNPMAPILTAVDLLRMRGAGTRELEVIQRQVAHLVQLVDDLLDIARITRGKVELRREVLDVRDVIARAVEMVAPLMEQRRHHLSVRLPEMPVRVHGDMVRLAQVTSNLLNNAAKYTPPGGSITVSAADLGTEISIQVQDNGAGMDSSLLPHVFELFVQGRRSSGPSQGGLGIGLALVQNLVRLHGGRVTAMSEGLGKGSTFEVRLPVATDDTQAPEPSTTPKLPSRARRILVVDDNVDAAMLVASALEGQGFEVVVAHDGPQALDAVGHFVPDVAVLDLGLPVMDGYELCAQLRTRRELERCRFIALTGYGQPRDRVRTRESGFTEHLVKPVNFETLLRAVSVEDR